jgi:SAM-dependent methyltransferase
VYPVAVYDGRRLPFPDAAFDAVFSSNVLEHVQDLDALLGEIQRVLRPGGLSLHLMPTSAWRFWSLLTHFGWGLKRLLAMAGGRAPAQAELGRPRRPSTLGGALASVLPQRHGEHGTALGELYSYRRRRWLRALGAGGLQYVADRPTGLFYTNALLLGDRIPLRARHAIAKVAGSACRIYCFQKAPEPSPQ